MGIALRNLELDVAIVVAGVTSGEQLAADPQDDLTEARLEDILSREDLFAVGAKLGYAVTRAEMECTDE